MEKIEKTEKMENIDKIIYFGHPKDTYDTEYELNCLNMIMSLYPECTIINPKDIKIAVEDNNPKGYAAFIKQMQKYYFSAIDRCSLLIVAKTRTGKISPGVQKEIEYADMKNIPIEYLNIIFPEPNRPTLTCYFCKLQFVVNEGDLLPKDEWSEWNRAATSEYSMKEDDEYWVDTCQSCNGIDTFAMNCKYYKNCSIGEIEKENCPKICQFSRMMNDVEIQNYVHNTR